MDNKEHDLRSILVVAVFAIILGGLFVLGQILSPPAIMASERRVPSRLPALSFETVISGEYTGRFDSYIADRFPFRDGFRSINSMMVFSMLLQTDKDGLYMDEHGAGHFRAIDPDSVRLLSAKLSNIAGTLDGLNIYYSFIPDKSFYSSKYMPGFDPVLAETLLTGNTGMSDYSFIDLVGTLSADSFYRTDLHWDQIKIESVLEALAATMGFDVDLSRYSEGYAGELSGVYAGQIALPIGTDSIRYLSCPTLSAMYYNEITRELEPGPVYNWEKLSGLDSYDFFLSGARPLIILENSEPLLDRDLYLFRDSFSSSLAPLLASAYSRVTLIDLRFIDMRTLNSYVEFTPGSDVLFLYSTIVLNNSGILLA